MRDVNDSLLRVVGRGFSRDIARMTTRGFSPCLPFRNIDLPWSSRGLVAQGAAMHFLRALGILILILPMLVSAFLTTSVTAADKDKPIAWKPITQALLRVDDQALKNWNVYQESKKADPLLLEIGNRFLLIQVRERKVFELPAAKIEHKGAELLWDPAALPAEPLASADWLIKDVGFAYRISMRLLPENRVFDLQLPHPMDLRYL